MWLNQNKTETSLQLALKFGLDGRMVLNGNQCWLKHFPHLELVWMDLYYNAATLCMELPEQAGNEKRQNHWFTGRLWWYQYLLPYNRHFQVSFLQTVRWRTITYLLENQKDERMVWGSSQEQQNEHTQPKDQQRLGNGQVNLTGSFENHHIQTEDGQRLENGQVNLTISLRTTTYILRMDRDWEKVRSTWQDHWEPSHTYWGWTEIWKLLGCDLKGSLRTITYKLRMEWLGSCQVNLTRTLRTITYILEDRNWEMVRST